MDVECGYWVKTLKVMCVLTFKALLNLPSQLRPKQYKGFTPLPTRQNWLYTKCQPKLITPIDYFRICDTYNDSGTGKTTRHCMTIIIERLRNPVRQVFSYGIRYVFIVIQWTVTHSSLNHNENMPYPVLKSCRMGFRNLCNNLTLGTIIH